MQNIRVASVQFCHKANDKDANFAVITDFVEKAAAQNVQLICFPEFCITGYWTIRHMSREQLSAIAEPVPQGPSTQRLLALSRKYNMTVGAGMIEIDTDKKIYNTYVAAMPDGSFARHRKLHSFENEHMSSGSEYTVFDTPHGCKVGILICYDNNQIENVRVTALMGAEILMAPHQTGGCETPSPFAMGRIDPQLWFNRDKNPEAIKAECQGPKGRGWIMRWLPSRAHDNGLFLIFSNGVGVDDNEVRTGNAMILDCYGRTLAESFSVDNDMVIADLDASLRPKCTGVRWMRTRRPDLYKLISTPTGREEDTRKVRFEGLKI